MNVRISISDDIYRKAVEVARQQNITLEDVLASALTEHLRSWDALQSRAARADAAKFQAVMSKVPDVDPDPYDRF